MMQHAGRLEDATKLRTPQLPLPSVSRPCCAYDFISAVELFSGTSGHSGFS